MEDIFKSPLEKLGEEIVRDLREAAPKDQGELANSIAYTVDGNSLIISMLEYGIYVDEGTKPHMPPISAIEGWAKRKGINPWALAKSIATYGTKAQPFLTNLKEFNNEYLSLFENEITIELEKVVYNDLKKLEK